MVLYETFSYKDADRILKNKGLLDEIKDVMISVIFIHHYAIQKLFERKGWGLEHYIFKEKAFNVWLPSAKSFKTDVTKNSEPLLVGSNHTLSDTVQLVRVTFVLPSKQ